MHLKIFMIILMAAHEWPAAGAAAGQKPFTNAQSPRLTSTHAALDHYLKHLTDSLQAEIGVAFRDLETGQEYFFNEKSMMHAASTMKVPVMIEVFRQAEAGKFRLEDSVFVRNQFASIVDGSPYSLDLGEDSDESIYKVIGQKMSVHDLVYQMITVSSNLATNLLIELVDAKKVMATLQQLGIHDMQVLRGVEDGKAYQLGRNNRTNALDLMLSLQAIAEQRAASPAACQAMIAILKDQKFRDSIPAGLPEGFIAANKTGSITAINHDAAIILHPNRKPIVLAILTRKITNHEQARATIAGLTRHLFATLVAPESAAAPAK